MDPYDKYPVKYGSTVPEMSRSYTLSAQADCPEWTVGDGADRLHRYGHERNGLHHVIDFDRY